METQLSNRNSFGTFCGLALIGYGVIGAIYNYSSDSESIIFGNSALFLAMFYLVLFGAGGLCVIAWFNSRERPDSLLAKDDDLDGSVR